MHIKHDFLINVMINFIVYLFDKAGQPGMSIRV